MKPLLSMGIDPSTSATGIVLLKEQEVSPLLILEHEVKPKDISGMTRNQMIVTAVMEIVHQFHPDKIVIEGYSLNLKNASSVVPLVELGGLLRFMLYLDGLSWYDPRASEVKQFVTGKGNSPKEVVMMNVFKRWGFEAKTNNTADAYVCAAMGLAQANRLQGVNLDMRKIAGAMISRSN